jgi:hypothetical protein
VAQSPAYQVGIDRLLDLARANHVAVMCREGDHRAWKGYLFEVLDVLEEKSYISQTRRAKSLTLTSEGVLRAQEILEHL